MGGHRAREVVGLIVVAVVALSSAIVGATIATAPPADAAPAVDRSGTIVFVRGGNVWIARADGREARSVTRDGTAASPYRTPTQDDLGRIYALRGNGSSTVIVRMSQQGDVLARFRPPVTSFGPGFASVSPDGRTLAYETMFAANDCSYTPCHTFFQHYVEYADAVTGRALPGSHHVTDGEFASWAGGRAVVQSTLLNRVLLHRPSEPTATEWFASCLSYQEGCSDTDTLNYFPAVNRQGSRFATARVEDGPGGRVAYLLVLSATAAATAARPPVPGAGCAHPAATVPPLDPTMAQMVLSAPSFSPDGGSVAFAERRGSTWTTKVYTPVIGDCDASDPVTVLADASQPHWSKAPLSAVKAKAAKAKALHWTKTKPKLAGKAKVGKRLKPTLTRKALRKRFAPTATAVRFQWLRNGHAIKHATKATYRVRKADRHRRLSVRITGLRPGHPAGTVTTRVKRIK